MKRIKPEIWEPADDMTLESNALNVAKTSENTLVVAGPGAGKTELLAQKASFLLQTNTCPYPYKILAISFKRDAAFNLKERVQKRCGDELSKRFESLTFDSFAKQILDRFKEGLPTGYRISPDYHVVIQDQTVLDFYQSEDIDYFNTTERTIIWSLHDAKFPHSSITHGENVRNQVWEK